MMMNLSSSSCRGCNVLPAHHRRQRVVCRPSPAAAWPHPSAAGSTTAGETRSIPTAAAAVTAAAAPTTTSYIRRAAPSEEDVETPRPRPRNSGDNNNNNARSRRAGGSNATPRPPPSVARLRRARDLAPALTAAVQRCSNVHEVAELFAAFSPALNAVHVTAMVARVSKLVPAWAAAALPPRDRAVRALLLSELRDVGEALVPTAGPRELAGLLAGFARALGGGGAPRRLAQLALPRCPPAALAPRDLAALAWAVAKSGHGPDAEWVEELVDVSAAHMAAAALGGGGGNASSSSSQSGGGFGPRETATVAWSLATLQRQCGLAAAPLGAARRCAHVGMGWFAALRAAARAALPHYGPPDIAMLLWALAALGHAPPRDWLAAVAARGAAVACHMEERHVAMSLWAVSRMVAAARASGRNSSSSSSSSSTGHLEAGSSTTLDSNSSSTLDDSTTAADAEALATLSAALQARTLELLPTMRRPVLNCAHVLAAFARLHVRPPAAFVDAVLGHAAAALAASVRSLPPLPASAVEAQRARPNAPAFEGSEGSAGGAAVARLAAHNAALDAAAALRRAARLRAWAPRDLATLTWGLAALGYAPPPAALGAVLSAASRLLHTFGGRELSLLMWSLARLPTAAAATTSTAAAPTPATSLTAGAVRVALDHPAQLNAQSAALLIWALARGAASGGAAAHRPGPSQAARLLQLFLSRVDDAATGAAGNVAAVALALPAIVQPSRLARLPAGARHVSGPELLRRLAAAAGRRLRECGALELRQLASGFARLRYDPGPAWRAAYAARCAAVAAKLPPSAAAELDAARAALDAMVAAGPLGRAAVEEEEDDCKAAAAAPAGKRVVAERSLASAVVV